MQCQSGLRGRIYTAFIIFITPILALSGSEASGNAVTHVKAATFLSPFERDYKAQFSQYISCANADPGLLYQESESEADISGFFHP